MDAHNPTIKTLTRLELYFSVRHVNKAMRTFAQLFNYDYETAAIFLTVFEACLQAIFHVVALDPGHIDVENVYREINSIGLTALTIGEQTGIPRETVRRKLKALIESGHLATAETSKNIYLPASTLNRPEFAEIFEGHIRDVAQLVRTVAYYQRDPV